MPGCLDLKRYYFICGYSETMVSLPSVGILYSVSVVCSLPLTVTLNAQDITQGVYLTFISVMQCNCRTERPHGRLHRQKNAWSA